MNTLSLRRTGRALVAAVMAASSIVAGPIAGVLPTQPAGAVGAFVDPRFREIAVFSGLTKPTSVRFASDGRAFVSEKGGVIKEFDSLTDTAPTVVADLSADVMDYWDRGLLTVVPVTRPPVPHERR